MVSIGSCDICGQFCASDIDDDGATAEEHMRLAERLHDCLEGHRGPWHDLIGRPLTHCDWCAELSEYYGEDNSLDHSDCSRCRAERPMLPPRLPRSVTRRPGLRTPPRIPVTGARRERRAEVPGIQGRLRAGLASTDPVDRRRVEHALRTYYGRKHIRIRWYDSPPELGSAFAEAARAGGLEFPLPLQEPEPWSLWPSAPALLRQRENEPYYLSHESTISGAVHEISRRIETIASAVEDLAVPEGSEAFPPLTAAGQFDVAGREQDVIDGFDEAAPNPDGGFLAMMAELRASAGPVLFFDDAFHVLDRPLVMRLDEELRLHCEDGPALAYPDGSEAWAVHGVVLPRRFLLEPESVTVADIEGETNAEVRRVLIERFGAERLLREGGAELVDEDAIGKLWRWESVRPAWPRLRPVVMVEVVNSTPEPDGSVRTYYLRVPPEIRTAREAVAWTFHLEANEYRPAQQT